MGRLKGSASSSGAPTPKASAPAAAAQVVMAVWFCFSAANMIDAAIAASPMRAASVRADKMIPAAMAVAAGINGIMERGARIWSVVALSAHLRL